jgi:hypothetical protein
LGKERGETEINSEREKERKKQRKRYRDIELQRDRATER